MVVEVNAGGVVVGILSGLGDSDDALVNIFLQRSLAPPTIARPGLVVLAAAALSDRNPSLLLTFSLLDAAKLAVDPRLRGRRSNDRLRRGFCITTIVLKCEP